MRFTIAELQREAIEFDESLPPGSIDFVEDVQQVGTLHTTGRAELLEEHRGPQEIVPDIRIRASLETRVQAPCARCLEPVEQPIQAEFDLIFRPQQADAETHDRAITASETEIGYYEGDGLLLEDVLREQILLALPAKILCNPDCKGLCPECGGNRNTQLCDCAAAVSDPRWSGLQDIRSRVKP